MLALRGEEDSPRRHREHGEEVVEDRLASSRPVVVAHRGLHKHLRENSIDAFLAAIEVGVPWIELDVWPSADDAIVVIHDETIDRTTAGAGLVWQKPWDELERLHLQSLPQVLDSLPAISGGHPGVLVEIKPSNNSQFVRAVLNEMSRCKLRWILQSFDARNLNHALTIDPKTPTAMLVETAAELYSAVEAGWPIIHSHYSAIDRPLVDRMHNAGRRLGAWTVNTPDHIERMIDHGVDVLITDEPELAMKMIATR